MLEFGHDLTWTGMVHAKEASVDGDGAYAPASNPRIEEPMAIMGVFDQTGEPASWTLDSIRVKAAGGRGAAAGHAGDIQIDFGTIGFIAIYKDE